MISNHQFDLILYDNFGSNVINFNYIFFDIIDNYNFDYVRTKLITFGLIFDIIRTKLIKLILITFGLIFDIIRTKSNKVSYQIRLLLRF